MPGLSGLSNHNCERRRRGFEPGEFFMFITASPGGDLVTSRYADLMHAVAAEMLRADSAACPIRQYSLCCGAGDARPDSAIFLQVASQYTANYLVRKILINMLIFHNFFVILHALVHCRIRRTWCGGVTLEL